MSPAEGPPHVAVVGGGVAGIAAARALVAAGLRVTLLEAGPRTGGCIDTREFAGRRLDVGAESVFTAAPEPLGLIAGLGLDDEVVAASSGTTWIASDRGLRALPAGVGPAGPTRISPLVGARLLSPRGLARAALEPLVPRRRYDRDVSVATAVRARFGTEVVDRVVDPLLGGLHAGDVRRLSLSAATPQLAGLLARHRSVVLAGRGRGRSEYGFVTLRGGLGRLVDAALDGIDADVRVRTPVSAIEDTGRRVGRYRLHTEAGPELEADGVVVAVPPAAGARVLAGLDPVLPVELRAFTAASVAVVLLAYPASAADVPALRGTGVLVPSASPRLLKAATFLTRKWPHLATDDRVLIRASAGRAHDERVAALDDTELTERLLDDLASTLGLVHAPEQSRVVRWPRAMPQLEVGHPARVARVRTRLDRHPGVALAGAAYDGVGIAAALRSGAAAADRVAAQLTTARRSDPSVPASRRGAAGAPIAPAPPRPTPTSPTSASGDAP